MSQHTTDRRTFLRGAARVSLGTALVGGAPGLLAACGEDDSGAAGGRGGVGSLAYQLGWIKNVQWAGSYIADRDGYYLKEGFERASLLPGGPSAPPVDGVVSSGKAMVGVSSPSATADAILQGAKLKIVGAMYQRSPYCIISPADAPIRSPQEMAGKRIGVPQNNQPTWKAFAQLNDLDASAIKVVPVGFNPSVLSHGQVDGLMAFVSNEPIQLAAQGFDTHVMRMSDFGYRAINNDYVMSEKTIAERPDAVKAFFRAEIRGWKRGVADPALSAKLTVEDYGADLGLNAPGQLEQSKVQNTLMVSGETKRNGLFTLSPELVDSTVRVLGLTGVKISAEQLFDLSLLEQVYKDEPSLV